VNRRRDVSTKSRAEPTQALVGRPLGPLGLGFDHLVHMSNTPCGDAHFDIWSTSLCNPMKCSNLVPKFLKSIKHYNRGIRLVDKVKHGHLMHILDMLAHEIDVS
jgi:hypothetical protein